MIAPFLHTYVSTDDVIAFSTTREGGVSTGSYASFNVNGHSGDKEESVAHNTKLLCKSLEIDVDKFVLPHQTHGVKTASIDEAFFGMPYGARKDYLEGVDAVVTNNRGVCVAVSTADCVPILLYDPVTKTIAAVHAGWRGTVQKIAEKVLSVMQKDYLSNPENIQVFIGPSISLAAFEVGDEVYEAFEKAGFPMQQIAEMFPSGKWHLDLWKANISTLMALGVDRRNIFVAGICSYEQDSRFFSARRLTINSGRTVSGIILK